MSYQVEASEVYAWLQDNPIGSYMVVEDRVADEVMLTQGGMIYKDDLWCTVCWTKMSPGTSSLALAYTPYKSRNGSGSRVFMFNADTETLARAICSGCPSNG
jgi:hypothetical protein